MYTRTGIQDSRSWIRGSSFVFETWVSALSSIARRRGLAVAAVPPFDRPAADVAGAPRSRPASARCTHHRRGVAVAVAAAERRGLAVVLAVPLLDRPAADVDGVPLSTPASELCTHRRRRVAAVAAAVVVAAAAVAAAVAVVVAVEAEEEAAASRCSLHTDSAIRSADPPTATRGSCRHERVRGTSC